MVVRLLKYLLLLVVVLHIGVHWATAQEADEPVVHVVLFFSPSCPHCHEAINNVMIPLMDEYGKQLVVLGVDTTTEDGNFLFTQAITHYQVPENRQGVPTLIYKDTVLVSTMEIENEFPELLDEGLAAGGVDWPTFPGLAEALVELSATETPTATIEAEETETAVSSPTPLANTPTPTPASQAAINLEDIDPDTIGATEEAPPPDPLGFTLGWFVVVFLLGVIVLSCWNMAQNRSALTQLNVRLNRSRGRSVVMWLLVVIGLIVAGYLGYVEMTQVKAVCGPVGECNIVQSSEYARLFGVPIAVWGILFYLTAAGMWLVQGVERYAGITAVALIVITFFGVLFSIYLTMIELLVIGAICAWCLTSAIVTGLMHLSIMTGIVRNGD